MNKLLTFLGVLLIGLGALLFLQPDFFTELPVKDIERESLIVLDWPQPGEVVTSPLVVQGEARGYWFFEASFPVVLTNWDGLILAEVPAQAQDEWMTEEFVPFAANLEFESPYKKGDPEFMKRGTLILHKDNPSGLPEHDAAHEITVWFAPVE